MVRLRRRTSVDVDRLSTALVGEVLVFGRAAGGERFTYGLVHDEWRVRFNGRLAWADNLHLTGDVARQMDSPAGFDGSRAIATLVYVSEDAPERLTGIRSLVWTERCRSGATLVGNVVIARWLGRDAASVRNAYTDFLEAFASQANMGVKALPVVWTV